MKDILPEMACELLMQCDLIIGILKCTLHGDTIDVDLKVHTLQGIHTYRKDRSMQVMKCSPWGPEVQPFPSLKKKMVEFMKHRLIIVTPFTNRSFQPRHKVAAKKCNLLPKTRLNRAKLSQPRKINVRSLPEATEWNWAARLGNIKDVSGTTTSLAPIQTSQPMDTPSTLFPTSLKPPIKLTKHCKYCAKCTPHGKTYPKESPTSSDWDDDE